MDRLSAPSENTSSALPLHWRGRSGGQSGEPELFGQRRVTIGALVFH